MSGSFVVSDGADECGRKRTKHGGIVDAEAGVGLWSLSLTASICGSVVDAATMLACLLACMSLQIYIVRGANDQLMAQAFDLQVNGELQMA